jgi:hypothetical protein
MVVGMSSDIQWHRGLIIALESLVMDDFIVRILELRTLGGYDLVEEGSGSFLMPNLVDRRLHPSALRPSGRL